MDPGKGTQKMQEYRERQKFYYERYKTLTTGDAVRIQTGQGWEPAEYVRKAHTPRSRVVKAGDQSSNFRL